MTNTLPAPRIIIEDMPSGYKRVLDNVRFNGLNATSRGMKTRELLGQQIVLLDPYRPLATNVGRKLNPAVGWVEAMQLVAGESYPNLMTKVTKNFEHYKDGEVFHGAYGPRIRPQMANVMQRLSRDSGSRQAVVQIWDPLYDNADSRKDLPCTLTFQFLVRHGELVMITTMRSNDAWLGFPYDIFQFTMLQKTIANCLGMKAGMYVHNVGSFHIYEEHLKLAAVVTARAEYDVDDEIDGIQPAMTIDGTGIDPISAFDECVIYARRALDGEVFYFQRNYLNPLALAVEAIHG